MQSCVVCEAELDDFTEGSDCYSYDCSRCGKFSLVGSVNDSMLPNWLKQDQHNASLLSYLLRKMQVANERPALDSKLFAKLTTTGSFPRPAEQARNFLLWLGQNVSSYDAVIEVKAGIQSVIGAQTRDGVYYVASHLIDEGYISGGNRFDIQYYL